MVDPKVEKTPDWTSYAYGANNPILMIDPDGQYAVAVHYRITFNALFKLGYNREAAARVAHYASVYADHPQLEFQEWIILATVQFIVNTRNRLFPYS